MAFNSSGQWVAEDQSVETPLNKLLAGSSDYIRNARNSGTAYAARRGLINSSIAAGSAQGAAIDKALPIASQDAAQTATNNLSMQNAGYADEQIDRQGNQAIKLAGVNNDAEAARLSTSIAGTAALQSQSDKAQMDRQTSQAAATAALQGQSDAAQLDRQQQAALASLKLQGETDQAALTRLNVQADATAKLQGQSDAAQLARQQDAATSTQKLQAQSDSAAMDRLGVTTAQADRTAALNAAIDANKTYATEFDNLANNKDIPAATRDSYIQQLQATRDSGVDMVQQIYGVKLNWNSAASQPSSTASLGYTAVPETKPAGMKDKDWAKQQAAAAAANSAAYGGSSAKAVSVPKRS